MGNTQLFCGKRFSFCAVLFFLAIHVGCGSPSPDKMFADRFDSRIKKLAVLYSTFQARNNWTGPADEGEFREYINGISEKRLARLEITKAQVETLFQIDRDGQPYKIRWSIAGGNGVPPKPILFEANGADGKYLVGFTNGISQEYSKDDYDKLWNGEGDDGSMIGFNAEDTRQ